ncbi:MAG: cytochrome d ubiquinol oxidase subunit II [Labilithrix sp.]|nr:cytochrome d ubiquinol oxidase subunit II [Labilithrix sp.]MCW5818177.1 cytochrome d ubiquinol oxidase subunit II [Labilithrix sp.]
MIQDLWFFLTCATFAAYVVLDGYDLGAGIVSPFVAKTDHEKHEVLKTILPFWDGNEVYLITGGATLYLAFPRLFPAFVSGFYLPVMIVLWLLALRGVAIEMRHKLDQPLWNELWDGGFFFASTLLVLFFGAAIGNVVRGVSVDENGDFFAPLWTDLGVGDDVGILDWYTLLVGAAAIAVIARHGALRLAVRAEDESVAERARAVAAKLLAPAAVLPAVATFATFRIQPNVIAGLAARPWTAVFGLLAAGGTALSARLAGENAYRASSATLIGLFGCACVGVYPYGLVARIASRSVLAADAAAEPYGLTIGLAWWLPGMALVVAYSTYAHRRFFARKRVASAAE